MGIGTPEAPPLFLMPSDSSYVGAFLVVIYFLAPVLFQRLVVASSFWRCGWVYCPCPVSCPLCEVRLSASFITDPSLLARDLGLAVSGPCPGLVRTARQQVLHVTLPTF